MDTLTKVNEVLKGSIQGTNELGDLVDFVYESFEELQDGFQITDGIDLINAVIKAVSGSKEAAAQVFDLQDSEINELVERSDNFTLGELANEARQIVKFILTGFQTYSVFAGKLG
ncbi:MAG: hypothetical protein PVH88_02195 [Ignavibacteria bacterium]|jgi:hypothetical protein